MFSPITSITLPMSLWSCLQCHFPLKPLTIMRNQPWSTQNPSCVMPLPSAFGGRWHINRSVKSVMQIAVLYVNVFRHDT